MTRELRALAFRKGKGLEGWFNIIMLPRRTEFAFLICFVNVRPRFKRMSSETIAEDDADQST